MYYVEWWTNREWKKLPGDQPSVSDALKQASTLAAPLFRVRGPDKTVVYQSPYLRKLLET